MLLSSIFPVVIGLVLSVHAGLYSNILKGLSRGIKGKDVFRALDDAVGNTIEDDEETAGTFVCEVLNGDVPDAVSELGNAAFASVSSDFSAVTSFIKGIPSLPEDTFSYIVSEGKEAASAVDELFTNPSGVFTAVVGDVTSDFNGIASDASNLWSGFTCHFGDSCDQSTTGPIASITSSCSQIVAAHSATSSPTSAKPTGKITSSLHTATPGATFLTPAATLTKSSKTTPTTRRIAMTSSTPRRIATITPTSRRSATTTPTPGRSAVTTSATPSTSATGAATSLSAYALLRSSGLLLLVVATLLPAALLRF